jgi:hypothetical protein
MTSVFERRDNFLAGQRKAHLAKQVVYAYAEGPTATVAAVVGRSEFELLQDGTVSQRVVSRDFIVEAGDLTRQPRRGDVVREEIDGRVELFELAAHGTEPEWRWADSSRTSYRVHTKHKGTMP